MTDPGDEHQHNDIVDRLRRMSNGLTPRSESDVMLEAAAEILRLRIEVQQMCPVCGAPLVAHGRFPRGRFSRLDHPSPPPLPPRDEEPEPLAQPPPRQAA